MEKILKRCPPCLQRKSMCSVERFNFANSIRPRTLRRFGHLDATFAVVVALI